VVITIAQQMDLIDREIRHGQQISFRQLLARASTRLEVIVTLLALLEMVKQLRVKIRQSQPFSDILILKRAAPSGGEPDESAPAPPSPDGESKERAQSIPDQI
jgi:segregation and condensation protein A